MAMVEAVVRAVGAACPLQNDTRHGMVGSCYGPQTSGNRLTPDCWCCIATADCDAEQDEVDDEVDDEVEFDMEKELAELELAAM